MTINTDFEIQNDKDIRYIGTAHGDSDAGYYTVIAFHRWLQDLADDASAAGDDFLDITGDTPSERSTDNIITLLGTYNIDDTASEHLYDGSIIQGSSGAVIYDGLRIIAAQGMDLQIQQNGAVIANDFWNSTQDGFSGKGLNRDTANGISHRFMLKVRTGGADIDGRRLITQTRETGFTFSEFKINGTSRGNNVAALTYSTDLNNSSADSDVADWTDITNTEGYRALDVNNDTVNEFYYSEWTRGSRSINQFYERMKYITRRLSSTTLYGLTGELFRGITHEIDCDSQSSDTWSAVEAVSWSGGTGQMLAVDSVSAATKLWIQLLTGVAPTDQQVITGGTSLTTVKAVGTSTERTLSQPFVGVSTGTSLIGSYGFGVVPTDLTASDKLFDLTNTLRQPPNFVTFTVTGLDSDEDYVLVAPATGSAINFSQLTLDTDLSDSDEIAVIVTATIPSDTPSTGTIRIQLNSGKYRRVAYTAYSGSTFTIGATDFTADPATAPRNVFISYIDVAADAVTESFTSVYSADRALFIRVRDGGSTPIKTFESTGTLGSAGGSSAAIRTSDS